MKGNFIRVNLLPEDLRPVERTPLIRLVAILIGVALTVGVLFVDLNIHLRMWPDVLTRKKTAQKLLNDKKKLAERYDELEKEIGYYRLRIDTVKKIARGRYLWSRKLYQLHKVIAEKAPDVALRRLEVRSSQGKKTFGGASQVKKFEMMLDGYSIVPRLKAAADFMKSLRTSEFFEDCEDVVPESTQVKSGEEGATCEFRLKVIIVQKSPQQVAAGRRGGGRR